MIDTSLVEAQDNLSVEREDVDDVALSVPKRPSDGFTVEVLREMFRNLQAWQSVYEAEGVDVLTGPDGTEWALWDVQTWYEMSQHLLPKRQSDAIRYFLFENLSEVNVSRRMGSAELVPVSMYASAGLETLVHLYRVGMLPTSRQFRQEMARAHRPKVDLPSQASLWFAETMALAEIDMSPTIVLEDRLSVSVQTVPLGVQDAWLSMWSEMEIA